ncbi:class I adenylate-forming enzyme family protein [Nocardioides pacificus]
MSAITDVSELLSRAAQETPDRPALVDSSGRTRSYAELDDEVARVASGLGAAGLVGGQRVLISLGNRIEFVTAYLGVLRAQLVAVPVNPTTGAEELARILEDCGARLVVADGDTLTAVRGAVAGLEGAALEGAVPPRVVAVGAAPAPDERSYDDLVAGDPGARLPVQDPESLAVLLYTRGTAGHPRAAMLSHRALAANIEQLAAVEPAMIRGDDVLLGVLPLFHVYGLNAVLGGALRHGARLVLVERFDPSGVLDVIEREGVTVVPVAPPVFPHWLRVPDLGRRMRSARVVLSGSAPLAAETMERFTELSGVPVHQGYGLTEAAPVVTSTLIRPAGSSAQAPHGSVGAAVPGVEMRLVDETGSTPSGDDPGEIEIRGDNLFSGYWPDGSDGPRDDGWWGTGDLGFLEASGDLFLVDRAGDVIVVSGFSVYPGEVEDVVSEVAGVSGAAVIGVPDEATGEAVVAYVRAAGAAPAEVESAVLAHCAERLARFKQPVRVEVVDELPQTASGRIQRGRVRMTERRRATGLLE